ncbi:hypothetical protein JXB31_02220 [Candidatus Woesearchaeota archaeon]|nr:hypothetical protein [Candidatus Woesearchaeota archaeon]
MEKGKILKNVLFNSTHGIFSIFVFIFIVLFISILSSASISALPLNSSSINQTMPYFSWSWADNATTNYTLVVDDDPGMGSPVLTHNNISGLSYTLDVAEALPGDDTYYWNVRVYHNNIHYATISYSNFVLDTAAPVFVLFNPLNVSWRNTTPTPVSVITDEAADCRYGSVPSVPWASMTVMAGNETTTHSVSLSLSGQGMNNYYFRCRDTAGNINPVEKNYAIGFDSQGPAAGAVVAAGGATYTTNSTVLISWSGFADTYSGILYYYYDDQDLSGTQGGTKTGNTTFSGGQVTVSEGVKTFYVWAEDHLGNIGTAASDSVIVDYTAPTLVTWAQAPANLRHDSAAVFNVSAAVNDANFLASNPPECRHRFYIGGAYNTSYTAWADMTPYLSRYWYAIDEDWDYWQGHTVYYECRVYDALNQTSSTTRSEYIDMNANPPTFVNLNPLSGTEGINLSFTIQGSDIEGDSLSFSSDFNFTFAQLTQTTATAWLVPENAHVGTNIATFYVDDDMFVSSQAVTFTVIGSNDPPLLSTVGNLEAYLHEPFLHLLGSTDPDNQNSYLFDDDLHTYGLLDDLSWFRITSGYNISLGASYGLINFTPLLSHKGSRNVTIFVSDGTEIDTEEITFTVGFCGDLDAAGEPKCDSTYESCSTCPEDCGPCDTSTEKHMAILVPAKNCVGRNFTLETYELVERGECEVEGAVINNREACYNVSDVTVKIFLLENKEWVELDEYTTDEDGRASFIAEEAGSYKLVAEKSKYEDAIKYLDFGICLGGEGELLSGSTANSTSAGNSTAAAEHVRKPDTETPGSTSVDEGDVIEETGEATLFSKILWYGVIPVLLLSIVAASYLYYEKEKNNVVWILKARIWFVGKKKAAEPYLKNIWNKARSIVGF